MYSSLEENQEMVINNNYRKKTVSTTVFFPLIMSY